MTKTSRYGCFNRPPLKHYRWVKNGWCLPVNPMDSSQAPWLLMKLIADPMTKTCQYSRHHDDAGCTGCTWKQPLET